MKRILVTIWLLHIISVHYSNGQENFYPPDIPPSPNASSMSQALEQKIDFYTGTPDITIPLYNIESHGFTLPIELSYHASGMQVEKMPSWVGLGWSLNAGGFITRIVRGLPDDLFYSPNIDYYGDGKRYTFTDAGYLYSSGLMNNFWNGTIGAPEFNHYIQQIAMGVRDGIPDLFYFKIGKYSGEFFFDEKGEVRFTSEQDLKIIKGKLLSIGIESFTIITPIGDSYLFSDYELSTIASKNHYGALEVTANSNPFLGLVSGPSMQNIPPEGNADQRAPFISTWNLTKIITQSKNEINFEYREEKQLIRNYSDEFISYVDLYPYASGYVTQTIASSIYIIAKMLQSITWETGNVYFRTVESDAREDTDKNLKHDFNNYPLSDIEIYSSNSNGDELVKGFELSYSYFSSIIPPWNDQELAARYSKRLKLEKITEFQRDPNDPLPPLGTSGMWLYRDNPKFKLPSYEFSYNTLILPHRASTEKDAWGYYNNNGSNDLIPLVYEYPEEEVSSQTYYPSHFSFYPRDSYIGSQNIYTGANKMANPNVCQACCLAQITYPTKGITKFVFESNEFNIQGQTIHGGGIRVKKIITSEDDVIDESKDIVVSYEYPDGGRAIDLPQLARLDGVGSEGERIVRRSSVWAGSTGISKGSFVVYPQVKEIKVGNGYIIRNFLVPATFGTVKEDQTTSGEYIYNRPSFEWLDGYNESDQGPPKPCSWEFFPQPYLPNYDWKRGLLDSEHYFSNDGIPIKSINYTYQIENFDKTKHIETRVLIFSPGGSSYHNITFTRNYSLSAWIVPLKKVETSYFGNLSLEQSTVFKYSVNHHQIATSTTSNSEKKDVTENFLYVADLEFSSINTSLNECKETYSNCVKLAKDILINCLRECKESNPPPNCIENCHLDYNTTLIECKNEYDACISSILSSLPENTKVYFNMLNQYNILSPVEIQSLVNNKLTKGTLFEYKEFTNNIVKGSKEYKINTVSPITNSKQAYIDNGSNLIYDPHYLPKKLFSNYDNLGNLSETKETDNIPSSFIWGYNGEYPVIQAKNISIGDLNSAVNLSNSNLEALLVSIGDLITDSQKADWELFNKTLRAQVLVSNSLITTYTFKKNVGVTSITDPAGISKYFEYDIFGRLLLEKDQNGNIVKTYEYHYKP